MSRTQTKVIVKVQIEVNSQEVSGTPGLNRCGSCQNQTSDQREIYFLKEMLEESVTQRVIT